MTWPTPYRPQQAYMVDTPEQIAARRAVLDELKPRRQARTEQSARALRSERVAS